VKTERENQIDVLDEVRWEPSMNAAAIGLDSSSDLLISSTSTTGFWPYPIER